MRPAASVRSVFSPSLIPRPRLLSGFAALLLGIPGAVWVAGQTAGAAEIAAFVPPVANEATAFGAEAKQPPLQLSTLQLGGHALHLDSGATLSWNGLTLNGFSSYPDSPTDSRFESSLAADFTPLSFDTHGATNGRFALESPGRSSEPRDTSRLRVGLSQNLGILQVSVASDYGRFKLPVHPEFNLAEEQKLLRFGGGLRVGGFSLRGTMGADVKPFKVGDALAWDLAATFTEGPWSTGVAYTHSILTKGPTDREVDTLGTLQGGVRYAFTPELSATANAMFWNFSDQDGREATDVAGVIGISLSF